MRSLLGYLIHFVSMAGHSSPTEVSPKVRVESFSVFFKLLFDTTLILLTGVLLPMHIRFGHQSN